MLITIYTIFRLFARPEAKKISKLIEVRCKECGDTFNVCRRCYRGHRYCSPICKLEGYRRGRRNAQKRYRRKEKGKIKHQVAEKKRRLRLWEKNREKNPLKPITPIKNDVQKISTKKTNDLVTVITATGAPVSEKPWHSQIGHCHFCGIQGVIVKKFPRRGYGQYKK